MLKAINTINSFDQCSQGLCNSDPWREVCWPASLCSIRLKDSAENLTVLRLQHADTA